jgi:hypothetical protein
MTALAAWIRDGKREERVLSFSLVGHDPGPANQDRKCRGSCTASALAGFHGFVNFALAHLLSTAQPYLLWTCSKPCGVSTPPISLDGARLVSYIVVSSSGCIYRASWLCGMRIRPSRGDDYRQPIGTEPMEKVRICTMYKPRNSNVRLSLASIKRGKVA